MFRIENKQFEIRCYMYNAVYTQTTVYIGAQFVRRLLKCTSDFTSQLGSDTLVVSHPEIANHIIQSF